MSVRGGKHEPVALLVVAAVVISTIGIALSSSKPLQFKVMSGVVTPGDHGMLFASDDFRMDWRAGKQFGIVGIPCSKNWTTAGYGEDSWGAKMHWRFEGAEIPLSAVKPQTSFSPPCTIEVRRIIELHVIE